jgi:hypothetical protein
MTNMTEVICLYFHPLENNRLLDYYKIISISRPILQGIHIQIAIKQDNENKKYHSQNRLIHGHFHIDLVIIPRPPLYDRGNLSIFSPPGK